MKSSKKHINDFKASPDLLKALSGKWRPQLFYRAINKPLRADDLPEQDRKTILKALLEMVKDGYLVRKKIKKEPLDFEYVLSEKGKELIPLLERFNDL